MLRIQAPGWHLLPLVLLVIGAGCAVAPVQEMSDARQAIAAAEEAGAEQFAPEPLAAARRYLADAERSLQVRSYGLARSHAISAKTKAVEALDTSQDGSSDP